MLASAPVAMAGRAPIAAPAPADKITVQGTVVDEENEPVIGAAINVVGTDFNTLTDYDGNFTVQVPGNSSLKITYVGCKDLVIPVDGKTNLGTLHLYSNSKMLEQVVVVGYGTQKKADLTGSVAVVDAEEMKKVSNSNISTMLEGKVPGVSITSDGQPGADPAVRIRGIGSFGDTSPLYVVDGVPMGTTIRDFSPNDIETIQILKDASAAAIYGSRAANGVIIITTKSGQKNQPVKVDYAGYVGFDRTPGGIYDVMDSYQFGDYTRMIYANSGMDAPSGYIKGHANYVDPAVVNTDWFKEAFKTGLRTNHTVNISGGGNNSTYNIALDYYNQQGTIEGAGPNFERYTARFNNTMDTKYIKFRTSVVYSHSDQDNMSLSNANEYVQGLYGQQFPVMASALLMPPTVKAYDESTWCLDDKISAATQYSYDSYGYGTYYPDVHGDIRMTNVLLTNNLLTRNSAVNRIILTGSAQLDLLKVFQVSTSDHKLEYNLNMSYSATSVNDKTFVPSFIQSTTNYLSKNDETLTKDNRSYSDGLVENFITYDGKFGGHHVNAVAGFTYQRETYKDLYGIGNSINEPYYLQVGNAAETKATSYESEHVLASYIGRINYDYKEKYLLSITARRDGSSRLSSADRWDWFPSVSLGWRIDKESFFKVNPSVINLLKIRGSYGVLGNENIGDYQYMDLMARGNYTYSFGNNKVTGSAISNYVNTAIAWEKKKTLDIGADISLLNNSIEINADYYRATSEDLLYSVPVPAEAGATNGTVTMNAATMRNSGIEFAVTYRNYHNPLKYSISANVSHNKNKVVSLGVSGESRIDGDCRTVVGQEVGRWYGLYAEGIFQNQNEIDYRVNEKGEYVIQEGAQPGDIAYRDVNNDGKITIEGDRVDLGSGLPKLNFGLSFRLEYNGFDLSCSTYGATGFKVLDFVDRTLHSSYGITNKSVDMLNAWRPDNTNTDIPRSAYLSQGNITNDLFSQRFLQDGTYWKIANVELGYNFKDSWFHGVIHGVRLYLAAQNLHTFTKYKGYNIDFAGGVFTPGYNYCSYPTPRTFMCGLHLSF